MIKVALAFLTAAVLTLGSAASALAAQPFPVNFHNFPLSAKDSSRSGTVLSSTGTLSLASTGLGGPYAYTDPFANVNSDAVDGSGQYTFGTWTSAAYATSFPFYELVASWNANTPAGTWIQVEVQPRLDDGHLAKWYILGRWAYGDSD